MRQLFSVVIVDDEPPARRLLTEMLVPHTNIINLIGEADSGVRAIAAINAMRPDVVFLDIQLPDMLGFDVISRLSYKPFVIFTTAYDEYAIKAFDELSIDYLLKPIKAERLLKALNKLQQFTGASDLPTMFNAFGDIVNNLKAQKEVKTISVKKGSKFTLVQLSDVLYFEGYDKYSYLYLLNGQKMFCDHMLSVIEEKLPEEFIRVQRSYIINKEKIFEIHKYANNRFTIVLNDSAMTRILTGPSYFNLVKNAFEL